MKKLVSFCLYGDDPSYINGAILNANSTEIQKARLKKNKEKQQEQEIRELKKDVSEIKVLLTKLVEKNA